MPTEESIIKTKIDLSQIGLKKKKKHLIRCGFCEGI